MKKTKKVIIALIAVLTALALFLVGVMSFVIIDKKDLFDRFKDENKYKTVIFEQEYNTEDIKNIKVDVNCADITFKSAEDEFVKVTVYGLNENKFSGEVKNGILSLEEIRGRVTFDFPSFSFRGLKIIVSLPAGFNSPVDIDSNIGDVDFQTECNFNLNVNLTTGDFEAYSLAGRFDISSDTGDVDIKNAKPSENSSITVTTGDIEIENVSNTKIRYDSSVGDEEVYGSDENSNVTLTVKTDTGDIEENDN